MINWFKYFDQKIVNASIPSDQNMFQVAKCYNTPHLYATIINNSIRQ